MGTGHHRFPAWCRGGWKDTLHTQQRDSHAIIDRNVVVATELFDERAPVTQNTLTLSSYLERTGVCAPFGRQVRALRGYYACVFSPFCAGVWSGVAAWPHDLRVLSAASPSSRCSPITCRRDCNIKRMLLPGAVIWRAGWAGDNMRLKFFFGSIYARGKDGRIVARNKYYT